VVLRAVLTAPVAVLRVELTVFVAVSRVDEVTPRTASVPTAWAATPPPAEVEAPPVTLLVALPAVAPRLPAALPLAEVAA
jgi:hypothetical protein